MLFLNFAYAFLLVTLTVTAFLFSQPQDAKPLLFFSGAVLICGIFALQSRRHGLTGTAILASLTLFTSCSRLFALINHLPKSNHPAFLINAFTVLFSATFLFGCYLHWQRRRRLPPPPHED